MQLRASQMNGFQQRLTALRGSMKDAEFARKVGIPGPTLKRYEEGSLPSIAVATKIADAFSVSLDWLCGRELPTAGANVVQLHDSTGRDSRAAFSALAAQQSSPSATLDQLSGNLSNLISIPAYADVRPSAGSGSVAANEIPTGIVAFDRGWLREIGVNPNYAVVLFADGDSMYPTIPNGSAMVVDTSKLEIRHGCIYVFDLDGDLMIKRIERLPDGTIDLISDNRERYPTRNVTRDRLEKMHVIGRVYSAVRTF